MSDEFVRSDSGQAAKHHFHEKVIVWVEGPDDALVFRWLAQVYPVRLEITGGKPRSMQRIEQLKREESPFVVIIDGDYEILTSRRSPHRRAVRLGRYSVENYFIDKGLVGTVYSAVAGSSGLEDLHKIFDGMIEQVETQLEEAVALDVASVRSAAGVAVLPRSPGRLMPNASDPAIDLAALRAIVEKAKPQIDDQAFRNAKSGVAPNRWTPHE